MKKLCCILLALLMGCACALAEENLLINGDFSAVTDGMPDGWRVEMWHTDAGISLLSVEADGCAKVSNVDANDARFAQTVRVEANSLYRLSGRIRAEGCDFEGYGATLSIGGLFVYSDGVYDTDGEWRDVALYGRTGPDQRELTVFARVGAYGTLSTGTA